MRLDDAVTYFLGQWSIEGPTPATVRTYAFQLNWLVKYAFSIGKENLADLTPELLRAAMAAKMAPTRRKEVYNFKGGEASAHSLAMAARKMAEWLQKQRVPVADLSTVRARKPPERIQPRVKQDEFQALEQAILHRLVEADRHTPHVGIARDLALIYLLADTGLRAAEVCAMTVHSIDFDQGAIIIKGKGRKERVLSIVDANDPHGGVTLRLLAEWIRARDLLRGTAEHEWLWTSLRGNPLTPEALRNYVLAKVCTEAGLPENRPPHTFRRMNFTESYLADPRLIDVLSQRMGWSPKSHQMVEVYTRGAKVELARSTPIPSIGARWATDSPNVRLLSTAPSAVNRKGAGSRRSNGDDPALVSRGRGARNGAASQNS